MSVQSLFPTQGRRRGPQPLVTFKAGKMTSRPVGGGKVKVIADKRRGTVSLMRQADSTLRVQWATRPQDSTPSRVEDNRVVFPGDVFEKIDTGREGDRIYQLKFSAGNQRLYFWMQEPLSSKDEENMNKMNEFIANPGAATAPQEGGIQREMLQQLMSGAAGARASHQAQQLAQLMQQQGMMDQGGDQAGADPDTAAAAADLGGAFDEEAEIQRAIALSLAQATGGGSGSATAGGTGTTNTTSSAGTGTATAPAPAPAAGTTTTTADGDVDMADDDDDDYDDDDVVADAAPAPAAAAAAAAAAAPAGGAGGGAGAVSLESLAAAMEALAQASSAGPTPLRYVMDSESLLKLLDDDAVVQRLLPHLPEGQRDIGNLREMIRAPQFKAALSSLTGALQNENINTVFANFNLQPSDGAEGMNSGDGVAGFVQAIQAQVDRERATTGDDAAADAGEGEDEDAEMKEDNAE